MRIIEIDGGRFSNLKGFYEEVERTLTSGIGWEIGRNLDAFEDVLEGGYGVHDYEEKFELIWNNSDRSRIKLGYKETVKYLKSKLANCHPDAKKEVRLELNSSNNQNGKTLFDIIVDIINDHQHISLKLI